MRKLVSFMHVSLDGFVAGPKGEMDWILLDDELFEYAGQRTGASDTALYGRVTYEMMEAYWPTAADRPNPSKHTIEHSAWYKTVKKVVLSTTLKGKDIPDTTIISDNIAEEVGRIKAAPGKEIIIFGSPSATHSLMHADLIDEYWVFVNPILLGEGIRLFDRISQRQKLRFIKSVVFKPGIVCLHYERDKQ